MAKWARSCTLAYFYFHKHERNSNVPKLNFTTIEKIAGTFRRHRDAAFFDTKFINGALNETK